MSSSAAQTGRFTMLGDATAAACEGDSCVVPGSGQAAPRLDTADVVDLVDIEPSPEEAAAASARAVTAALDEGASL